MIDHPSPRYPLAETATSWRAPFRESAGYYFVAVEGYDQTCADQDPAADCVVRSNILRVAIPNRRPSIERGFAAATGYVHLGPAGVSYSTTVRLRLRICDDSRGTMVFRIRQVSDRRVRRIVRRRTTPDLTLCEQVRLAWSFPGRLLTAQRFRIALRMRDAQGRANNLIRFNLDAR